MNGETGLLLNMLNPTSSRIIWFGSNRFSDAQIKTWHTDSLEQYLVTITPNSISVLDQPRVTP